jgi:phosphopantetheinyl transferase
VAVAAGVGVGVDVEMVRRTAATPEELAAIEPLAAAQPDAAWETRLWCAKEAAAKALGTGLQGRPRAFEVIAAEPDGSVLVRHAGTGERLVVHTLRREELVIAGTANPDPSQATMAGSVASA